MIDIQLDDEQQLIRETVQNFAMEKIRPAAHDADESGVIPESLVAQAWELGLVQGSVPEAYGGSGANFVTCCLAGEAVGHAGVDGGHTLSWGAHTYLCAANIMRSSVL